MTPLSLHDALPISYGEDYTDEGGVYRYAVKKGDLDSPCIYFTMDQDKVVGISLYSASNM